MTTTTTTTKTKRASRRWTHGPNNHPGKYNSCPICRPTWYVERDCFPNEMWTIRNVATGETLKTKDAIGFYRTRSVEKAKRDADKLNRKAVKRG